MTATNFDRFDLQSIFQEIEEIIESVINPHMYGQASTLPIPTVVESLVPRMPQSFWLIEFASLDRRKQNTAHLRVPRNTFKRPNIKFKNEDDQKQQKNERPVYGNVHDEHSRRPMTAEKYYKPLPNSMCDEPSVRSQDIKADCKSLLDHVIISKSIDRLSTIVPKVRHERIHSFLAHCVHEATRRQRSPCNNHEEETFTSVFAKIPGRRRQKLAVSCRRTARRARHVMKTAAFRGKCYASCILWI